MRNRTEQRLIAAARVVGLVFFLMTAGCAGFERTPPREPAATGTKPGEAVAPKPAQADASREEAVAARPEARPAPPPVAAPADPSAAKAAAPAAKAEVPIVMAPAKVAASPAPAEPARKKEAAAPPSAKPAAATLDLAALEKRLKETSAIGVFTKLTLKNQVDDLLNRFRAHYEGRVRTTLAQLRQPYDLLILKVLSLLQDRDPTLAGAVVDSREAIWGILSDPDKFKTL